MELALSIGEPVKKSPENFSRPIQLDLLPFASVPRDSQLHLSLNAKNGTLPTLLLGQGNNSEDRSSNLGGFDVNQIPSDCNNDVTVSSPNSNGKRDWENETERGSSRCSDEEGGSTRKKLRLSKDQYAYLEESFKEHSTLNPKQKMALAKLLNLRPRQVEVWFQNRRARTKLKQTEVDLEYLKRCCESLTEENRRLQKELQELKALKATQPFYMQLPATTLTMCPSCERVAAPETAGKNGSLGTPKPRFFPFPQQTPTAS